MSILRRCPNWYRYLLLVSRFRKKKKMLKNILVTNGAETGGVYENRRAFPVDCRRVLISFSSNLRFLAGGTRSRGRAHVRNVRTNNRYWFIDSAVCFCRFRFAKLVVPRARRYWKHTRSAVGANRKNARYATRTRGAPGGTRIPRLPRGNRRPSPPLHSGRGLSHGPSHGSFLGPVLRSPADRTADSDRPGHRVRAAPPLVPAEETDVDTVETNTYRKTKTRRPKIIRNHPVYSMGVCASDGWTPGAVRYCAHRTRLERNREEGGHGLETPRTERVWIRGGTGPKPSKPGRVSGPKTITRA